MQSQPPCIILIESHYLGTYIPLSHHPSPPTSHPHTLGTPKTPAQSTPPLRGNRHAAPIRRVAEDGRGRRHGGRREGRAGRALDGDRGARVGRAQRAAGRHAQLRAGDGAPGRRGRVGRRAGHRAACRAGGGGGGDDWLAACGCHYEGGGAGLGVGVSFLRGGL